MKRSHVLLCAIAMGIVLMFLDYVTGLEFVTAKRRVITLIYSSTCYLTGIFVMAFVFDMRGKPIPISKTVGTRYWVYATHCADDGDVVFIGLRTGNMEERFYRIPRGMPIVVDNGEAVEWAHVSAVRVILGTDGRPTLECVCQAFARGERHYRMPRGTL